MNEKASTIRDRFESLVQSICERDTRIPTSWGDEPIRIMEVCGTHTVTAVRSGLHSLLPAPLSLISGPGCPVCVTPESYMDVAVDLAGRDNVTITTYGDMIRVPGSTGSLEQRRREGADVRIVYSVRDALEIARKNPQRQVVFLAVGFETTAPATAAAVRQAQSDGLDNFSALSAHKRLIPAMKALLKDGCSAIDGFLCPGHVSVIIGSDAYQPIAEGFGRPCVVAGFEPGQMLAGMFQILEMLQAHKAEVDCVYPAAVKPRGNAVALRLLEEVFEPEPSRWRGLGEIPDSGLGLRDAFSAFDAFTRFDLTLGEVHQLHDCRCAEVIMGLIQPPDCPLFGASCIPADPIGPCMVSSEGACAAWYKYRGR